MNKKKKERMGSNPLDWIGESAVPEEPPVVVLGRPRTNFRQIEKTSQKGLPEGWTRATFILREAHLEDLKDLAYWDRRKLKDILDDVITGYIQQRRGTFERRPSRRG